MTRIIGKTAALTSASVVALTFAAGAPAMAWAQSAPQASASADLAEVVVTARRREERLQDVPVAVTAVTGEELKSRSVNAITDLTSFTPNLRLSQESRGGSIAAVSLRGQQSVNLTIANDPAVGIYFDEVPVGRTAGAILADVQDMQSVQVLRGNQGTLFGRNNTGGAILLTPNRANLQAFEASAEVTFGNYGLNQQSVVVSAPVVNDRLGVRFAYQRLERNGTGDRYLPTGLVQKNAYGTRDRQSGRASIRFEPTDALSFNLTYDITRVRDSGPANHRTDPPQVLPAGFKYGDALSLVDPDSYFDSSGVSLNTQWSLNADTTFKIISGYRQMDFRNTFDADGTPATSVDVTQAGRQTQFSIEANLSGVTLRDALPFARSVDYVFGGFYFSEQGLDENYLPPRVPDKTLAARYVRNVGNNTSLAAYGQVEAHFTEATSAWVGLRYTLDTRAFNSSARSSGRCTLVGNPVGCLLSGSRDFAYGSWSLGVRHAFTQDINVYFRAGRGQRAGGLDDTPTTIDPFNPEVLQDYELGLKADWFDHLLRTNLAIFYGDFKSIQRSNLINQPLCLPTGSPQCAPYTSVLNLGDGHTQGLELEATLRPAEGLVFNGALGYIKAEFDTWTGLPPNLVGLQFQNTPKWSYALSANYTHAVGDLGDMTARVDYGWKGRTVLRYPTAVQNAFALLNARLSFRPATSWKFRPEIAIWGKNLTDKHYSMAGQVTGGTTYYILTDEPRTYGITLSLRY